MKGWLDNYGKADNANDSNISLPEGFVGLGYNTEGRKFSPAWGGQFQKGGNLVPVSPMEQITGQAPSAISPTVPYLKTKDPVEFYQSWIESPEYERRQLLTGYSSSAKDESLFVPSAEASRKTRLELPTLKVLQQPNAGFRQGLAVQAFDQPYATLSTSLIGLS